MLYQPPGRARSGRHRDPRRALGRGAEGVRDAQRRATVTERELIASAASASPTSRRRRRSNSANCRRRAPARSRSSCCAIASGAGVPSASISQAWRQQMRAAPEVTAANSGRTAEGLWHTTSVRATTPTCLGRSNFRLGSVQGTRAGESSRRSPRESPLRKGPFDRCLLTPAHFRRKPRATASLPRRAAHGASSSPTTTRRSEHCSSDLLGRRGVRDHRGKVRRRGLARRAQARA